MHRSRLCHFVIDVPDLEQGVAFWSAALNASEEIVSEQSRHIYRRLRLPDAEIRILLQKTGDGKASKERMHLDLESDDVEAEVARLEALGATRWNHQAERGFDFWVLRDPSRNGLLSSSCAPMPSRVRLTMLHVASPLSSPCGPASLASIPALRSPSSR